MKLKFDASLSYQLDAIQSIVKLFDGQLRTDAMFSIDINGQEIMGQRQTDKGLANYISVNPERLHANLKQVQISNALPDSSEADFQHEGMNFSLEMETGTGKTYVYLRSIFELHKHYGYSKFVIVVPSVPIREGVLTSIDVMRHHFGTLYGNTPFNSYVYDSKQPGQLRQFATANTIQILVINIQSFQKDIAGDGDLSKLTDEELKKLNVIYRENDRLSGERPIDFVRAARPIVILDEPQNMESDKRDNAVKNLNPLCTLRFSATHKNLYNLIYRLDPIAAYDKRLVKRIEVASIVESNAPTSDTYAKLVAVSNKQGLEASVEINVGTGAEPKRSKVKLKQGDNLLDKSKGRQEYSGNWVVTAIDSSQGFEYIEFANGSTLTLGESLGGNDDEMVKAQIRVTIEEHLKKERVLRSKGIKVLTLFFVNRVADYRIYNDDGTTTLGPVGQWFEEIYAEESAKKMFKGVITDPISSIHYGYFSQDKKKVGGNYVLIDKDTRGNTAADDYAYELIMRKKERLLDLDEPLRFIFSHSALREGWDNPNVFQICTLRADMSEIGRRQTIGRGLRLPVDKTGMRVHDTEINRLTVIANESYELFANKLQTEYETDLGIQFGKIPDFAFVGIEVHESSGSYTIDLEKSQEIVSILREDGYISKAGTLTDKFNPSAVGFELKLPERFQPAVATVVDKLNTFVFKNRVVDARKRQTVKLRKQVLLDPQFEELWKRISPRTRYRVDFDSALLIENAARRIRLHLEEYRLPDLQLHMEIHDIDITEAGIEAEAGARVMKDISIGNARTLPDILGYLQNETELTRQTLSDILCTSRTLDQFKRNPQAYLSVVTTHIRAALHDVVLEGLRYEKIDRAWEMHKLEEEDGQEIVRYLENLYTVKHPDKYPFDHIEFDSMTERKFAESLDANEQVKLFVKLPSWFKVDTPVGAYNPDWAVVFEGDETLYLVRETKSTLDSEERRKKESQKILCGQKHFRALGVDFKVVTSVAELV